MKLIIRKTFFIAASVAIISMGQNLHAENHTYLLYPSVIKGSSGDLKGAFEEVILSEKGNGTSKIIKSGKEYTVPSGELSVLDTGKYWRQKKFGISINLPVDMKTNEMMSEFYDDDNSKNIEYKSFNKNLFFMMIHYKGSFDKTDFGKYCIAKETYFKFKGYDSYWSKDLIVNDARVAYSLYLVKRDEFYSIDIDVRGDASDLSYDIEAIKILLSIEVEEK